MGNKGYKQLIKQKNFIAYVLANVINRFGDSLDSIAFTWIIYMITGNAFWSALIFGVNRLPTIFLQPFIGVLVDRMNKRFILITTDILRGLCVLTVAVGFSSGWLNEWHLLVITIIISSAEAFRMPASASMLPHLLNEEDYEYGVSLNQGLMSTVELVGLATAGFIIGWLGVTTAIIIDMITFLLCSFILLFIKLKPIIRSDDSIEESYVQELKKGFRFVKNNKLIWYILILAVCLNGIFTPFNALQAPLVKEILHSSEMMLSIIGISITIGGICGSFLYPKIIDKLNNLQLVKMGSFSLILMYAGPVLVGRFIHNEIAISCAILGIGIICGILIALLNTFVNVLTVKIVKPEYLGRINSILYAISGAAMPVISFLTSILALYVSTEAIFIICILTATIGYFTIFGKKFYVMMEVDNNIKE